MRLPHRAFLSLILAAPLLLGALPGAGPAFAAEGSQTFRDLGYGDFTARTMHGALSYFFALPAGQVPREGSQLEVIYSHSPLLMPDRSTMTVVANGQSLTSVFLKEDNRDRARLTIPLPTDNFRGNGWVIDIRFHLRLTRDECEETTNPALWATIHGESRLVLNTQASDPGPGLEDVPTLFAPSAPLQGATAAQPSPTLAFVLPQNATPEELDAAGIAAYGAGRWAAAVDRDLGIEIAANPSADRPTIVVGSGANLPNLGTNTPLRWDGQNFAASAGSIPANQGALAVGQNSAPQLVISGGTPALTRIAAAALVDPTRSGLLRGAAVGITGSAATGAAQTPPWVEGAASFAQLGFERRQFTGPGEHTLDLAIERPAGWTLRDGAALDLMIESSPALRGATSWVAASVNGYEIGSRRLDGGNNGRYHFDLPAGLLDVDATGGPVRRLALQVRLFLDLPQQGCAAAVPGESAWLAVLPTSSWSLPHGTASGLDLARFPFPLTGSSLPGVAVVIPQGPTADELAAGLTVLAAIGRHTPGEIAADQLPKLVTADRLTEDERKGRHLILIGGPDRNSQSAAASNTLKELFTLADPAASRPGDGDRRGLLRLVASPFASARTVLAVGGNSPEALKLAADALNRGALLAQLRGKAAVIVGQVGPQTVTPADNPASPPAALAPQVQNSLNQRLATWQIIGATGFGALLAALLLIVGARMRRREA